VCSLNAKREGVGSLEDEEDGSSFLICIAGEVYSPEVLISKYPPRGRVFAFPNAGGGNKCPLRGRGEWFVGVWRRVVRREGSCAALGSW
jgi:hypothetical protein